MLKVALKWLWSIPFCWHFTNTNISRHMLHAWLYNDYGSPCMTYANVVQKVWKRYHEVLFKMSCPKWWPKSNSYFKTYCKWGELSGLVSLQYFGEEKTSSKIKFNFSTHIQFSCPVWWDFHYMGTANLPGTSSKVIRNDNHNLKNNNNNTNQYQLK